LGRKILTQGISYDVCKRFKIPRSTGRAGSGVHHIHVAHPHNGPAKAVKYCSLQYFPAPGTIYPLCLLPLFSNIYIIVCFTTVKTRFI